MHLLPEAHLPPSPVAAPERRISASVSSSGNPKPLRDLDLQLCPQLYSEQFPLFDDLRPGIVPLGNSPDDLDSCRLVDERHRRGRGSALTRLLWFPPLPSGPLPLVMTSPPVTSSFDIFHFALPLPSPPRLPVALTMPSNGSEDSLPSHGCPLPQIAGSGLVQSLPRRC